jgi:glutamyl-tRNA(Gln) amidotransferase subunit D
MYSARIESILRKNKIRIGDRVAVKAGGKSYEGLLMPKTDSGDPDVIVLKLDSGYNIGIRSLSVSRVPGRGEKVLGKGKNLKLSWDRKKPRVSLVAAGGTIASRVDYRTGGVYAVEDTKEFLYNVPELAKIINLERISKPVTKMSEDMGHKDWIAIARAVFKELKESRGVIVTHGTDTLHYTSAALSFFLRDLSKPVVLVGAQKSADRGSSDAGMNLICAARLAVSDFAEVGTCMHGSMNDDYCLFIRGTKVRKMNTVRRDAFRPINDLPLAKVFPDGKIEIIGKCKKRGEKETKLDARFDPHVALLKVYPSSDPGIMDYYISKGCRGFVIEGTGLGHVPTFAEKSWIPRIKKAVRDGIPVVVTAQTIYGRINPRVYTNLRILYRQVGAIPGEDMLSEVAYVKLGYVLAKTKDMDEIKKLMLTNMAGEITERSLPETFLY